MSPFGLSRKAPLTRHAPLLRKTPLKVRLFLPRSPLVATADVSLERPPLKRKARKAATVAEKAHLDAVQALGCIVCHAPALIHHVRSLHGQRITRNHRYVLPLCWDHHSADSPVGFHAGSKSWQKLHGSEEDLLTLVDVRLGTRTPKVPAWAPCDGCGEMMCAIHDCHTGDAYCNCPGTEVWDLIAIDPYSDGGDLTPEELNKLIEVTHG